jgi:redox-sensing transcriptional repressor
MKKIPLKTIQRLILYRKILSTLYDEGVKNVFSHKLAQLAGGTPAQVRRDLMYVGYNGSPARGYVTFDLADSISTFLDPWQSMNAAIVGIGNLGRAIVDYCNSRHSKIRIAAAFDKDAGKTNHIIHGIRCYHISELAEIVKEHDIKIGLITVPSDGAQIVADALVAAGVKSLLNFSRKRLQVPEGIFTDNLDMMMSLELAAYFARG